MINRVSEVLHFLGHAYHSLSDIILKVRNAPPRALLCRPILIQHSAIVQTGFPAHVEVNFFDINMFACLHFNTFSTVWKMFTLCYFILPSRKNKMFSKVCITYFLI